MKRFIKSNKMSLILLLSIIIGILFGFIFDDTSMFKPFGQIFINLMYTLVVPLVFFTISSSISNMVNLNRLSKILKTTILVFILTSLISSLYIIFSLKFVNISPGNIELISGIKESVDIKKEIVDTFTVSDFSLLLSKSNMLALIIFSSLFGISVALLKDKCQNVCNMLNSMSNIMIKMVKLVMYYAPIGLCAYFASLVGEYGPKIVGDYARTVIFYYCLCIFYFVIVYTFYAYLSKGKSGVKVFYKNILPSILTSFATSSSLATLPTNMEVTEKMGVTKDVCDVVLPIGSTIHMEGSSMSSILKIAFLFAVFNRPFTGFTTYIVAIVISLLSSVVMSGIPAGGLLGEIMIVSLYSFPVSAFPIIATIGILIDPPATCINVCGDTISAMLITKLVDN